MSIVEADGNRSAKFGLVEEFFEKEFRKSDNPQVILCDFFGGFCTFSCCECPNGEIVM